MSTSVITTDDIVVDSQPSRLYRFCTLGHALVSALQRLVDEGKLQSSDAMAIMRQFDESMQLAMRTLLQDFSLSTSVVVHRKKRPRMGCPSDDLPNLKTTLTGTLVSQNVLATERRMELSDVKIEHPTGVLDVPMLRVWLSEEAVDEI